MRKDIKITKRDIKEDKFTTFMLQFKDYFLVNWMYFAAGAAAVVIVLVAVMLYKTNKVEQNKQAEVVFNRAMTELNMQNYQLAVVDFKSILEDYGNTTNAPMAAFNLANAYYGQKNFDDARAAFENYLARFGDGADPFFVSSAIAGIADCNVSSGNYQEAADKYREAAEKYPDFQLAPEYLVKAMRYYIKADNTESAKVVYAKIADKYEGTRYEMEAQRMAGENQLPIL